MKHSMMNVALTVAAACAMAALGCDSKKNGGPASNGEGPQAATTAAAAGPKIDKAPTIEKDPNGFDFKLVEIGAKGHFLATGLNYTVYFDHLPAGTDATLAGKKESGGPTGYLKFEIDLSGFLGAVPLAEVFREHAFNVSVDPQTSVELTYPGGVKQSIPLTAQNVSISDVVKALEKVADHPVTFGEEPAAATKDHTIVFVEGIFHRATIGAGKTLRDVDLVAIAGNFKDRPSTKTCDRFWDDATKTFTKVLPLVMVDEEVTVYERKTGKVVDKKTFEAPPSCPTIAHGNTARVAPNLEDEKQWLRKVRGA